MWAIITDLELILRAAFPLWRAVIFAVVKNIPVMDARVEGRLDDVPSVLNSVHMADFVAVIGRNRQFADAHSRNQQLNDDFRIKVKIIGVPIEWNFLERSHRVNPVAGMKLAKLGLQQSILAPREDFVANEFVKRHAAL